MLFEAIFLTLFLATWTLLGGLVWLGWSLRRRAVGAIWALPFALLGGAAGGVLVPLLGLDNGVGVGVSMIAAPLGGALITAAAYRVWDAFALGERLAARRATGVWPPAGRGAVEAGRVIGGDAPASIDSEQAGGSDAHAGPSDDSPDA